jgi:hypothetical protein
VIVMAAFSILLLFGLARSPVQRIEEWRQRLCPAYTAFSAITRSSPVGIGA